MSKAEIERIFDPATFAPFVITTKDGFALPVMWRTTPWSGFAASMSNTIAMGRRRDQGLAQRRTARMF
jgi:hypothetical protein